MNISFIVFCGQSFINSIGYLPDEVIFFVPVYIAV